MMNIDDLIANPCLFLNSIDMEKRQASLVKVSKSALTTGIAHAFNVPDQTVTVELDRLIDAATGWFDRVSTPRFIFMTDFCGSTLIWTALRRIPSVLGLNQISIFAELSIAKRKLDELTTSAQKEHQLADWRTVLRTAMCLTARAFSRRDVVLIKEWPLANYIIADILGAWPDSRAIFLYGDSGDYINAAFRRPWRRDLVRRRMVFLSRIERLPWSASEIMDLSDAQMFAAHWILQQRAYLSVDPIFRDRIKSVHSGHVLCADSTAFQRVARHFALAVSSSTAEEIHSETLGAHSKTGEPYSLAERAREIRETAAMHETEIQKAHDQLAKWKQSGIWAPERLPWPLME